MLLDAAFFCNPKFISCKNMDTDMLRVFISSVVCLRSEYDLSGIQHNDFQNSLSLRSRQSQFQSNYINQFAYKTHRGKR